MLQVNAGNIFSFGSIPQKMDFLQILCIVAPSSAKFCHDFIKWKKKSLVAMETTKNQIWLFWVEFALKLAYKSHVSNGPRLAF